MQRSQTALAFAIQLFFLEVLQVSHLPDKLPYKNPWSFSHSLLPQLRAESEVKNFMSIKKSVLSILLTSFPWHPFSEKQHSWKYLAASMSQQVSICLFSGRDFVPATEFSNKCQCCSQSSRNSAQKTNGEGKHNSFFLIANLYRTLRSTGWWHSDLDNEHDIFIVILSSLNVSTPVTIHQCTRRGSSLPFLHISFIPVWLHLR